MNLIAAADQLSAAAKNFVAFLEADPPPVREQADAWFTILETVRIFSRIFERFEIMGARS
jgi:hypothetical protein